MPIRPDDRIAPLGGGGVEARAVRVVANQS
jgi:hypothetical protein